MKLARLSPTINTYIFASKNYIWLAFENLNDYIMYLKLVFQLKFHWTLNSNKTFKCIIIQIQTCLF